MPSLRNKSQLKQIKDQLDQSSGLILVDYTGVPVNQQQTLRTNLQTGGNSFNVAKNTLLTLALKTRSKNLPPDIEQALNGPTAAVYAQDVVSAAKTLTDFTKDHPTIAIKIGLSLSKDQDRILTPEEINQLSKLPSKDQLYANLLNQLNAPAQSLVRLLSAPLQNLSYLLQNIADRG